MNRRNTPKKEAVLQVLRASDTALSHDLIQQQLTEFDRATLYRILNRFHQDGIVHKIVNREGKQYFALCTDCKADDHHHNHFHFQCTQCDKVECIDEEVAITLPKGYVARDFNGVVVGLCPACS